MSEMLLKHFDLLAQAPDGVARLRELILTLAVQGKLVPQDPNDEPASVLLQRIRAEKDRLIAEGKIKRDKPLPSVIDTEKPFELPVGWEWVRLQHVGYTQTGTTPDKRNPQFYGSAVPFIKPGDIYHDRIDYENEGLTELGLADSGRLAPAGSILMVCIGTIGKSNLCQQSCSFNQQINSVTPTCCSPDYINLYLWSPSFQSEAWAQSSSTTISILNKGKWEAIPVALPPLLEQFRIVARVEELMRLCDALEAKRQLDATLHAQLLHTLLGTLTDSATPEELSANWQRVATHFDLLLDRPEAVDALEQTILQLAVRGLLVPQDPNDEPASVLLQRIRAEKDRLMAEGKIKRDKPLPPITDEEKPFELPLGWEWVRFGDASVNRDAERVPVSSSDREKRDKVYDYYGASGVIDKIDGFLFDKRLLLIGEDGANLLNRSTPIAFLAHGKYWVNNHAHVIDTTERGLLDYLALFINAISLEPYVTGTAQPKMNQAKLNSIPVALPSLAEQSSIVARVEELRQLCTDLRQRLTATRTTQGHLAEALVECV